MMDRREQLRVTGMDLRIGLTVALCLLACRLASRAGVGIQSLAACTAAVMCVQESGKASLRAGMTRLLGVLCGGVVGIAVVLIDDVGVVPAVFFVLAGMGTVLTLLLCRAVRIAPIAGRVGCMTFLLVILVAKGEGRIGYALARLIGTSTGALLALLVAVAWDAVAAKRAAGEETIHSET